MKDSEFLELLNLYLDHEISTEQATRLEAEVTSNAERRKMYRQYCMMQKGCSLLSGAFVENAPAPQRQRAAAAFDTRQFWRWSGIFATGGLAAAAALVALFAFHTRTDVMPAVATAPLASTAKAAASDVRVAMAPVHIDAVAASISGGELQTVINFHAWSRAGSEPLSLTQTDPLAWTDQVQFAPLAREVIDTSPLFKTEPTLLSPAPVSTQVTAGGQHQQIEDSAFQFQR